MFSNILLFLLVDGRKSHATPNVCKKKAAMYKRLVLILHLFFHFLPQYLAYRCWSCKSLFFPCFLFVPFHVLFLSIAWLLSVPIAQCECLHTVPLHGHPQLLYFQVVAHVYT
ncbi:hypothetical protein CW304_28785 [Bacillus sp. UFRGS-B20]|nr:hypothetical protein CW304_28785 [Bacillus sp. UFRGS-B20]